MFADFDQKVQIKRLIIKSILGTNLVEYFPEKLRFLKYLLGLHLFPLFIMMIQISQENFSFLKNAEK